jgi:hypothetical protein
VTRAAAREAKRLQKALPPPFGRATDDNDVWEAVYYYGAQWCTRKQIADGVGRRVTPGLVARIERLVSEGKLERTIYTLRNGAQGYMYRAVEA